MQCHSLLYYVMYLGTLLFAVQFNVFIKLLWFFFNIFFRDAADNEHSYLVEIPVEHSILERNTQKSDPRSLQLQNIIFSSKIEICS